MASASLGALRPRGRRRGPRADPCAGQRPRFDQRDEISRRPAALARPARLSSLVVDQPGTGEALRLQGLHRGLQREFWASQIVDWLETRDDVDARRIGCEGVSLGGYFCPRAVAFEPRFACGVAWGAITIGATCRRSAWRGKASFPVPHYWEHVRWVWGASDIDDFMPIAENVHLDGVLDRIKVPVPRHPRREGLADSAALGAPHYEQLINSPKRELKIFTEREGGVQHCSFDNSPTPGLHRRLGRRDSRRTDRLTSD